MKGSLPVSKKHVHSMALCLQGSCTGLEGGHKALGLLCTWTWGGQMKDKGVDSQQAKSEGEPACSCKVSPAPTLTKAPEVALPGPVGATAHTEES